jgi:hypothetical protein
VILKAMAKKIGLLPALENYVDGSAGTGRKIDRARDSAIRVSSVEGKTETTTASSDCETV